MGAHADDPEEVIAVVRDWLCIEAGCDLPGPCRILGAFIDFMAWDFDRLSEQEYSKRDIERIPTMELLAHMAEWVELST